MAGRTGTGTRPATRPAAIPAARRAGRRAATPARAPRVVSASQEARLEAFLPALRAGRSVLSVAEELKVSQRVVRRARAWVTRCQAWPPPILTADEEAMIVKKLIYYAERGAPMTQVLLRSAVAAYVNSEVSMERRELIHQTFVNGRPGRKWLFLFIGRHPEVTKVYGRSLSAARAAATNPENLARMCALMKQVPEEKDITSENVFNADECSVDPKKLMSSRRQRYLAGTGKSVEVLVPTVASNARPLRRSCQRHGVEPVCLGLGSVHHQGRRKDVYSVYNQDGVRTNRCGAVGPKQVQEEGAGQ